MSTNRISRISVESIEDFDDVKSWARDIELLVDSEEDEVRKDISDLQDRNVELKSDVSRSIRLLWYTSVFFAAVLMIVVLLGGMAHIFK